VKTRGQVISIYETRLGCTGRAGKTSKRKNMFSLKKRQGPEQELCCPELKYHLVTEA
jgi:hypothetical protein